MLSSVAWHWRRVAAAGWPLATERDARWEPDNYAAIRRTLQGMVDEGRPLAGIEDTRQLRDGQDDDADWLATVKCRPPGQRHLRRRPDQAGNCWGRVQSR